MATQPLVADAPPDAVIADPIIPDAGEAQTEDARDYEAEALKRGWRPETEFKGDPAQFIDAETFIKREDEMMPLLKKKLSRMEREVEDIRRENKKIKRLEQNAYQTARADVIDEMEKAVESGDIAAFRKLQGKMTELETAAPERDATRGEDANEQFLKFRRENKWFDKGALASADPAEAEARVLFIQLSDHYVGKGLDKELSPSEFFEKVRAEVEAEIPQLHAKPTRQKATEAVAGTTRPSGVAKSARVGANLPADAKATAERYMRQGVYKVKTNEEAYNLFAKDYDWS